MESETLRAVCESLGIRATSTYGARKGPASDWQRGATGYTVTLRRGRQRLTVDFWMGSAHTSEPTAADVLACLVSDASGAEQAFESWAGDLGYETDSREAERIYRACRAMAPRVRRFLGDTFDRVAAAEH